MRKLTSCVFAFFCVFNSLTVCADVDTGLSWLSAQQQVNGGFPSSEASVGTEYQATLEVINTLNSLDKDGEVQRTKAIDFLKTEVAPLSITELTRSVQVGSLSGEEIGGDIEQLLGYKNKDNGFGGAKGLTSTSIDTAEALQALNSANYSQIDVLANIILALQVSQEQDGSFPVYFNTHNKNYVTANVLKVFQRYKQFFDLNDSINLARNFLDSQRIGLRWASVLETSEVLTAIIPTITDTGKYRGAIDYLKSNQLENGSWANDVYTTALAIRAIDMASKKDAGVLPVNGQVSGSLKDQKTSFSVSGVTVELYELGIIRAETVSNQSGQYKFENLVPGSYRVKFSSDQYITVGLERDFILTDNQNITLPSINLKPLNGLGTLSGVVTDSTSSVALSGAIITVTSSLSGEVFSRTTNALGQYLASISVGQHSISISRPGFKQQSTVVSVEAGKQYRYVFSLTPNDKEEIDQEFQGVKGVVKSRLGQEPILDVQISVEGLNVLGATDKKGGFSADGDYADTKVAIINFAHKDFEPLQIVVPLGNVKASYIDVGTLFLQEKVVSPESSIIGRVIDSETGNVIANAFIELDAPKRATRTTADGLYSFNELMSGRPIIKIKALGYLEYSGQVTIPEEGKVTLDIELTRLVSKGVDIAELTMPRGNKVTTSINGSNFQIRTIIKSKEDKDREINVSGVIYGSSGRFGIGFGVTQIISGGEYISTGSDDGSIKLTPIKAYGEYVLQSPFDYGTLGRIIPPGQYMAILQVSDLNTNELLSERGIGFEVIPNLSVGGQVEFDPPISLAGSGAPVSIKAQITNTGNQDLDDLQLTATVRLKNKGEIDKYKNVEVEVQAVEEVFKSAVEFEVSPNGTKYFADNKKLYEVTEENVVKEYFDFNGLYGNFIADFSFSKNGKLFILSNINSVVVVEGDKQATEHIYSLPSYPGTNGAPGSAQGVGYFDYGRKIEVISDTEFLVAGKDYIYAFTLSDLNGEKIAGKGLSHPRDLVKSSNGAMYIANEGANWQA